jgi:DNA-binding transcriptional LysR family regulator
MDVADLKVFEAVARLGGMSRAAAELHTVQSNVTARIRLLEDRLKAPLFERHSRGVALAPAGHRLLPYAIRIMDLLGEARRAAMDDGVPRGPLVFGALETTTAMHLSPLLASFVAAWPEVELSLRTGTTAELIEGVLERRLEAALVCGPVDHPELTEEAVCREELVVLTAPAVTRLDGLLERNDVKIVVLRLGCSYRQRLEEILARRGVVGLRQLEFGTLEAIYGCVAAGLGITLLPRGMIGPVWRDGRIRLHTLSSAEAVVETVHVRRRDRHASSGLIAFLAHLRAGIGPASAIKGGSPP